MISVFLLLLTCMIFREYIKATIHRFFCNFLLICNWKIARKLISIGLSSWNKTVKKTFTCLVIYLWDAIFFTNSDLKLLKHSMEAFKLLLDLKIQNLRYFSEGREIFCLKFNLLVSNWKHEHIIRSH